MDDYRGPFVDVMEHPQTDGFAVVASSEDLGPFVVSAGQEERDVSVDLCSTLLLAHAQGVDSDASEFISDVVKDCKEKSERGFDYREHPV